MIFPSSPAAKSPRTRTAYVGESSPYSTFFSAIHSCPASPGTTPVPMALGVVSLETWIA